jgi:hypothetical protein
MITGITDAKIRHNTVSRNILLLVPQISLKNRGIYLREVKEIRKLFVLWSCMDLILLANY